MLTESMLSYKNRRVQDLNNELGKKKPCMALVKSYAVMAARAELDVAAELLMEHKEQDAIPNVVSSLSCMMAAVHHPLARKMLKDVLEAVARDFDPGDYQSYEKKGGKNAD